MKDEKQHQDQKKGLSRRRFLGISGSAAALAGLPAWFPQMSFAQTAIPIDAQPLRPATLIKVFGRGGWDGLSISIPYGDAQYYPQRPASGTLAFTAPGGSGANPECLNLDGFFGFPKAMESLYNSAWVNRDLAIVNAIGLPPGIQSFSHFIQQDRMETAPATANDNLTTGWIGRHLDTRVLPGSLTNPVIRGTGLSVAVPKALVGGPDTIATPDPANYNLKGDVSTISDRLAKLRDLYVDEGKFDDVALKIGDYIAELQMVDFAGYTPSPGVTYPSDPEGLGDSFKAIAAILEAGIHIEAFGVDFGGWDHHADQDPLYPGGKMYDKMFRMAEAFNAFYLDLTAKNIKNWIVYANSEFGRKLRENDNEGTDHGSGNCMLLMSPTRVNGGVHGTWPNLPIPNPLPGINNTLDITTDIRLVAAEMIDKCLHNGANLSTIFPGFSVTSYLNIFK